MLSKLLFSFLAATLHPRPSRVFEKAAFRHKIEVLQRNSKWPNLPWRDSAIWDILSLAYANWHKALYIVKPETLVKWHRMGFWPYWR